MIFSCNSRKRKRHAKNIVLASASPRRSELLKQLGVRFKVDRSNLPEHLFQDSNPRSQAITLSHEKAAVVAGRHHQSIIIAADTLVVFEGEIVGKPLNAANAKEILARLSGKVHSVITGLTLIDTDSRKTVSDAVETKVHIKQLSQSEIGNYVSSRESLDKAGGYAIQGLGGILVDRIEGDYYNVVGMPLACLVALLKKFDINII